MALLQISEPGQAAAPHEHRLAAGIDLGTTNSLVATVRSGLAETLPDEAGRHLLPSIVRYIAEGPPVVGHDAKAASAQDPLNTIVSIKRLMGRDLYDAIFLFGKTGPNLDYLKSKLGIEDKAVLKEKLIKKIATLNLKQLAANVEKFLFNPSDAKKILLFERFIESL